MAKLSRHLFVTLCSRIVFIYSYFPSLFTTRRFPICDFFLVPIRTTTWCSKILFWMFQVYGKSSACIFFFPQLAFCLHSHSKFPGFLRFCFAHKFCLSWNMFHRRMGMKTKIIEILRKVNSFQVSRAAVKTGRRISFVYVNKCKRKLVFDNKNLPVLCSLEKNLKRDRLNLIMYSQWLKIPFFMSTCNLRQKYWQPRCKIIA